MSKFKIIFSTVLLFLLCSNAPLFAQTGEIPTDNLEYESPDGLVFYPDRYAYVLLWDVADKANPDEIYGEGKLDRPPLFGENCTASKSFEACTDQALQKYFSENIEYPMTARRNGNDGLEHLIFVVNEMGQIEGNIKVLSKEGSCSSCAKAAVDAIANMPLWTPARRNGLAVKSKVILPIRFDLKDNL
ncbi:MAG: energy transducer TonB [Bacteroidota bacterium]